MKTGSINNGGLQFEVLVTLITQGLVKFRMALNSAEL